MRQSLLFSLGLMLALIAAGCGPKRPPLAPVGGTVTFEGKPLKSGKIQFVPADGRSATGKIRDGRIENVSTFDRDDGVLVGPHRVAIFAFVREPVGMEIVPWLIPQRYGDPATSGLTVEIQSGKKNNLTFDLAK